MRMPGQNMRCGARILLKNHGFRLTAALTMALSIGANMGAFGVVEGWKRSFNNVSRQQPRENDFTGGIP